MSEDRFASPKPKKRPTRPPKRNILIDLTIRVLRGLIDQLEGIVNQLENPSFAENSRSRERRKRSLGYHLSRILSPIRRILPDAVNRILPDPILAIAIGAILIVIFAQIIQEFPQEEPTTEIAETNPSNPTPTEIVEKPLEEIPAEIPVEKPLEKIPVEAPPLEAQVEPNEPILPENEVPILTETPARSEDQEDQIEPLPEAENPPENQNQIPIFIIATAPPEPINLTSPSSLELTPEQYLMSKIRAKMSEATAKISPEIIVSVRGNFSAGLLRVELSQNWYELEEKQQNKIAEILFNQAQNFDFTKIELRETNGKTLARSAVIGSNIIILNRTKSAT
ncbi:hypothetical protein ACL6C3_01115 [Capilliphycus salinus ALCB114379]|uniref:hypothetical protein n=1 Tax=Capilliphycus salinus TaxID=2768948 RepID=UPI0039A5CA7F